METTNAVKCAGCGVPILGGWTLCENCVASVNTEAKRELDMLKAMNFALKKIFGANKKEGEKDNGGRN